MSSKSGLQIFSPKIRLLIVVIFTSLFAFIYSFDLALISFISSLVVLILGFRLVFKKVFFFVILINSIYMILGNWLFSPEAPVSTTFFIFRINDRGLYDGIVGALKRNAMIILSFAWLSSINSLYDVFLALDYSSKTRKVLIVFLKWIQNLSLDITQIYYSLQLRAFDLNSKNLKKRIILLKVILKAILNKFFSDIGKMTFNGESHFNFVSNNSKGGNGSIELSNYSVSFDIDSDPILKNINLTVNSGEVVLVTGKNNSGKSTLLKAISGYIPKIEGYIINGSIKSAGLNLNSEISLKEINRHIRYIVENPADSIIGLNVKQELLSQTTDISVVKYYSTLFGISHLWDRDINTLSGGEQSRVVLASLLCSSVNILVLESPLNQLDPLGRESFVFALKELINKDLMTIIISDYYAEYFEDLLNRVLVLDNGKLSNDFRNINKPICKFHEEYIIEYPILSKIVPLSTSNKDTLVQFEKVSLIFDSKSVVSDLSFEIKRNDCIAIMGNNGSGKTLSMLMLANVLKQSTGIIKRFSSKIGMVFQDCTKQILEISVYEELSILCKNTSGLNSPESESFITEHIEWSNLSPTKQTLDISASEKRLLEISSNIFKRDIIIFDEPSSHLSKDNIIKFRNLVQSLITLDKTVIIITHDKSLASICNRFLLLHNSNLILNTHDYNEISLKRNLLEHA